MDPAHVNRMERAGNIPGRVVALGLARVYGLTPNDRDRLLYRMGHAPVVDWQRRCEEERRKLVAYIESLEE